MVIFKDKGISGKNNTYAEIYSFKYFDCKKEYEFIEIFTNEKYDYSKIKCEKIHFIEIKDIELNNINFHILCLKNKCDNIKIKDCKFSILQINNKCNNIIMDNITSDKYEISESSFQCNNINGKKISIYRCKNIDLIDYANIKQINIDLCSKVFCSKKRTFYSLSIDDSPSLYKLNNVNAKKLFLYSNKHIDLYRYAKFKYIEILYAKGIYNSGYAEIKNLFISDYLDINFKKPIKIENLSIGYNIDIIKSYEIYNNKNIKYKNSYFNFIKHLV